MDKNSIIVFILFVLLLGGVVMFAGTSSLNAPAAIGTADGEHNKSSLVPSETMYDFGTISMANGKVRRVFNVSNPTAQDIKVNTLTTSCMCTVAYIINEDGSKKGPFGMEGMGYVPPANEVMVPGGSLAVEVEYDPNAHGPAGVGAIDRFVYLTEEGGATLQLEIKAEVTP